MRPFPLLLLKVSLSDFLESKHSEGCNCLPLGKLVCFDETAQDLIKQVLECLSLRICFLERWACLAAVALFALCLSKGHLHLALSAHDLHLGVLHLVWVDLFEECLFEHLRGALADFGEDLADFVLLCLVVASGNSGVDLHHCRVDVV